MRTMYTYTTKAVIILDDEFQINMTGTLDQLVCKAEWACGEYGFEHVDIIDAETGEVLVIMESEG